MSLLERLARALLPNSAEAGDPHSGMWMEKPGTWHLPDPYGPDPVVFGYVPRVRGD